MAGAIFGMLGAIPSAIGAMEGAEATREAAQANWQINVLNYYMRNKERQDRINMYETARRETKLGSTDAQGNRTRWDPAKGWVAELAPESKHLQNLQMQEQRNVLEQDLPMRRDRLQRNARRQLDEDYTAKGFLQELRGIQKEDPTAIRNLLYGAMTRGVGEAYNRQGNQAMKTALRTGASNTGAILASLARGQSDALARASADAELKSMDFVDQQYNQRRSAAANFYNLFAERGSRMPDVSYAPQNIGQAASALLSQFASQSNADNRGTAEAYGQKGGTIDYVQPDMGAANGWASMGSVIGGIGSQMGGMGAESSALGDAFAYADPDRRLKQGGRSVY